MKGEWKTIANNYAPANDLGLLDDVLCTDQLCSDRRAYKRNSDNPTRSELPSGYDIMLCDDPTSDLTAMVGREAIVCLDSGQLVLRQIQRSSKSGLYDLCDRFADPVRVTRDVQPRWAAALVCGIVGTHWEKMLADGQVQSITDSLH